VLKEAGFEVRQVIDIKITKTVTEYRAHILKGKGGKRYMAKFPEGVTQPIQYGNSIKTMAVYMSQYQLIPYNRVQDFFTNEFKISMSMGTLFNFNKDAYDRLEEFDEITKEKLKKSTRVHADETGININKEKFWLHTACNDKWTHFYPHEKRGSEAIDAIGILPNFKGVLCHDHWKSYYTYTNCLHSLCNAHHIRELQGVIDNNKHGWAQEMQDYLCTTNEEVQAAGGVLSEEAQAEKRKKYREILARGDIESPPPIRDPNLKKKGRLKKEKHRNLLERLRDYEDDVLRFMTSKDIPFTNNLGENDLRMTKVQQKISGCFRALEGAKIFCRVRGYLLTCQKHSLNATEALEILFSGKLPDFCYKLGEGAE
jgi:transposase